MLGKQQKKILKQTRQHFLLILILKTAYWIYSPGDNASMWEEFNQLGIMGIGWDGLGYNLKDFPTKQDIKEYLKNIYDAKRFL